MNFPDMTGGFIFLGIVCGIVGYGVINLIIWVVSHIEII